MAVRIAEGSNRQSRQWWTHLTVLSWNLTAVGNLRGLNPFYVFRLQTPTQGLFAEFMAEGGELGAPQPPALIPSFCGRNGGVWPLLWRETGRRASEEGGGQREKPWARHGDDAEICLEWRQARAHARLVVRIVVVVGGRGPACTPAGREKEKQEEVCVSTPGVLTGLTKYWGVHTALCRLACVGAPAPLFAKLRLCATVGQGWQVISQ